MRGISGLVILLLLLAACGSDERDTPNLAAPPTRTAIPPTATTEIISDPGAEPGTNVLVISMLPEVNAFLTAAEAASPLDRPTLFDQHIAQARPDCVTPSYYPGVQPLEMFGPALDLVSLDLAAWRSAEAIFPEAELRTAINDMLQRAEEVFPVEPDIRICILPIPGRTAPQEAPNGGVDAQVLGGDLVLAWCSAGDYCLPYFGQQIAYTYHYAYQISQAGLTIDDMTLLNMAIFNARASDFTRHLYPEASFPWENALTPEQESKLWADMSPYFAITYQDYPDYRKIDRFLYGYTNPELYPAWGGLFLGEQILSAYRESHPEVTLAELAALSPQTVLEESGYAPE